MASSGYLTAEAPAGRVWSTCSNPSHVNPTWIGGTAFDEMSPILVYRNPVGSGVNAQLDSLTLFITNTPGAPVTVRVMSDRIDRYSLFSGTLNVNGNSDPLARLPASVGGGAMASGLQVYDEMVDLEPSSMTVAFTYKGVVVNVAGAPGDIDGGVITSTAGSFLTINFGGTVVLRPGTVAGVYCFAPTTGPQGRFATRWLEKPIVS